MASHGHKLYHLLQESQARRDMTLQTRGRIASQVLC